MLIRNNTMADEQKIIFPKTRIHIPLSSSPRFSHASFSLTPPGPARDEISIWYVVTYNSTVVLQILSHWLFRSSETLEQFPPWRFSSQKISNYTLWEGGEGKGNMQPRHKQFWLYCIGKRFPPHDFVSLLYYACICNRRKEKKSTLKRQPHLTRPNTRFYSNEGIDGSEH